jgi:hypothetical protein
MSTVKIYGIKYGGDIIYVGQTCQSIETRFYSHIAAARGLRNSRAPLLHAHFRENNFTGYTVEILEFCNIAERFNRERHWIDKLDTFNKANSQKIRKIRCNKTAGGMPKGPEHYMFGKPISRHVVEASIAARIGKPLSEEHKAKQRAAAARNRELRGAPKEAKHLSDPEIIAKRKQTMRNNRLKRKSNRPVTCDQTGETWPCLLDCAKHHGVTPTQIYQRMKFKDASKFRRSSKLGMFTFT